MNNKNNIDKLAKDLFEKNQEQIQQLQEDQIKLKSDINTLQKCVARLIYLITGSSDGSLDQDGRQ